MLKYWLLKLLLGKQLADEFWGKKVKLEQLNILNPHCTIHPSVHIISADRIKLGAGTFIGAEVYLHGGGMEWSKGKGLIKIGTDVEISPRCIIYGAGEVSIDDKTILGPEVKIMAQSEGSFHNPQETSNLVFEPVSIGKGCYLGTGSVILGGTELGDNCIVSPNSVVKGKYPANTTLVGNPARVIPRLTNN